MKKPLVITLITLYFGFSCALQDDFEDLQSPQWTPEFAIPLANASFGIEELLGNLEGRGYLSLEPNGLIVLHYTQTIVFDTFQDLLTIPDQVFTLDAGELESFQLDLPEDVELASFSIESFDLEYTISNPFDEPISVVVGLPQVDGEDGPYEQVVQLEPGETLVIQERIENVNVVPGEDNILTYQYQAFDVSGEVLDMPDMEMTWQNIQYEALSGFLGQKELRIEDNRLEIKLFDRWVSGEIRFEDPQIDMIIRNRFGIPFNFSFENFRGQKMDQEADTLNGDFLSEAIFIDAAEDPAVGPIIEQITIDQQNSNLLNVLSIGPQELIFDVVLEANPDSEQKPLNTLTSDSDLEIDIDLALPLVGDIDAVRMLDTLAFSFQPLENVQNAQLQILTQNTFPLSVDLQVYLADSSFQLIDTLLQDDNRFMEAGHVLPNGEVQEPSRAIINIPLNPEKYNRLSQASYFIVELLLNTPGEQGEFQQFLDRYGVDLAIGVSAKLNPGGEE